MLPDMERGSRQLFQFTVPSLSLPGTTLALGLHEVLEVTRMPTVTPLPFAPPFVLGLGQWRGIVATTVDMAIVLGGVADNYGKSVRPTYNPDHHYVIAQVIVEGQREVVAWPILPGAGTRATPPRAPRAQVPSGLPPEMVHIAISLAGQTLVLLNPKGLVTLEKGQSYRT